jgi:hypothetical protein
MSIAKIQFSPKESRLVQHADLILTKNRIIGKLCDALGKLGQEMEQEWRRHEISADKLWNPHKISKGENFRGLPYIVLDFPREFGKDDVLAIRTLFWWGNYFSITLQLKGRYKQLFEERLKANIELLSVHDFLISISEDEWAHQVNEDHYGFLSKMDKETVENIFKSRSFVKLVRKVSLDQWQIATNILWENFQILLKVMGT